MLFMCWWAQWHLWVSVWQPLLNVGPSVPIAYTPQMNYCLSQESPTPRMWQVKYLGGGREFRVAFPYYWMSPYAQSLGAIILSISLGRAKGLGTVWQSFMVMWCPLRTVELFTVPSTISWFLRSMSPSPTPPYFICLFFFDGELDLCWLFQQSDSILVAFRRSFSVPLTWLVPEASHQPTKGHLPS